VRVERYQFEGVTPLAVNHQYVREYVTLAAILPTAPSAFKGVVSLVCLKWLVEFQ